MAESDLLRIWGHLEAAGSGVHEISGIQFDSAGKLSRGEFDCSSGFVRQRYVYDPAYILPADVPNERWHTKIDSNWYFIIEDWN